MVRLPDTKPIDNNVQSHFGPQNSTAQSSASNVPVGQGDANAKIEELLKKLGIDYETYLKLCEKNPKFTVLSLEEQQKIIAESVQVNTSDTVETVTPEDATVENKADTVPAEQFNHAEFSKLSKDEKLKICSEEYAKNIFLFGDDKKTLKDWNALSDAEKQKLINNAKASFKNVEYIDYYMTKLQIAKKNGISVKEYDELSEKNKPELCHDYIMSLDESNLSERQAKYKARNEQLTACIIEKMREKGKDIGDVKNMSPSKINEYCDQLGVTKWGLLAESKENKLKNDKTLSKTERHKIRHEIIHLKKSDALERTVKNRPIEGFGRLEEFKKTINGFDIIDSPDLNDDEKVDVLMNYMEKMKSSYNLKDPKQREEYRTICSQLITDVFAENSSMGIKLQKAYLRNCDKYEQIKIAESDTGYTQELNTVTINEFHPEAARVVSETQRAIAKIDPERGKNLASMTLNFADNEHLQATSETYARFGIKDVEDKHAQIAYDKDRVDAETQKIMLQNTFKYSNDETAKNAGIRLDEAYKENQLDLYNSASVRDVVKSAMQENGTFSRLSQESHSSDIKSDTYSESTYNSVKQSLEYNSLAPDAKNLYDRLNADNKLTSKEEFFKRFNKLTDGQKSAFLAALPDRLLSKLPVKVCEKFPSLIPKMVAMGRGIEILTNCSSHTFRMTVDCMKNSDDSKKQLYGFIADNPAFFTKASQDAAKEYTHEADKIDSERKPISYNA